MQSYIVGGAVRDEILGLPVQDRDYVVVGATPDEMVRQGYKPVGKDFPVFLHPKTRQEYALARTERKSGRGYKGFTIFASPDVTLEEDLQRRDLTINAIAKDETGKLIDPFNGIADLKAGVLRHVSPAFVEDPVRVLRVARFAARFNFHIADETQHLMREMVRHGEVDHLVPERVWQELSKGLMEHQPSRMFDTLRHCGALKRILPELDALWGVPQPAQYHPEVDTGVHVMMVLDYAARQKFVLPVRVAALLHDLGKATTPVLELPRHIGHEQRGVPLVQGVCERLRFPNDCRDLAVIVTLLHGKVHRALELRPDTTLKLLHEADALRQPERFELFLQACEADHRGREGYGERHFPEAERLRVALKAAQSVDAGAIARDCSGPEQIKAKVFEARVGAIRTAFE